MNEKQPLREAFADHWYDTLSLNIKLFGPQQAMKATIPHAFTRSTANGVEYAEVERIGLRLRDFRSWHEAWAVSARAKERLAAEAKAAGRLVTAREAYLSAAYLYHYAQLFVRPREADKLASRRKSEFCYANAAPYFDPPAQRVDIPYIDGPLAAYLRLPEGKRPLSAVIMVNGADSTKEELHYWADYIVQHGMAVLYFDGPGQGETAGIMRMPIEYERVASAAMDYLYVHPEIESARIGIWGISTGGYLIARSVAFEHRTRAAVSIGGFYDARKFPRWPFTTQENFCLMFGFVDQIGAMQDFVRARITLRGLLQGVQCPFLIQHGVQDHLIDMDEIQQMADEIRSSELVVYPDGDHALCNVHRQAGWQYADWLAEHLR
jgi:2,6-dihydroxypseudooxynicotine hydrolase